MKIKTNQLAELILEDGQPSRAMINYLQETMELLSNYDCVTDYYTKSETHPIIAGIPKLKLTKDMFMDFLSVAYGQIRENNEEELLLTDLFMGDSYEYNKDEEDGFNEGDTPSVQYSLSFKEDKENGYLFMVVFHEHLEPVICNIEVTYWGREYATHWGNIKFEPENTEDEWIELVITGTNGAERIHYNKDVIRHIIPISKVSF